MGEDLEERSRLLGYVHPRKRRTLDGSAQLIRSVLGGLGSKLQFKSVLLLATVFFSRRSRLAESSGILGFPDQMT